MKTEATMGDRLMKALLVMLILAASCFAQTPDELRRKYGKQEILSQKSSQILVERYMVRPGIMMTVKFGDGGRACELRIEPRRTRTQNARRVEIIEAAAALHITEELAPALERGRLINTSDAQFSCASIIFRQYERVMIAVTERCAAQGGGTYSIKIRWKDTACEQIDRTDRAAEAVRSFE